jgi:hypothetical protein
MDHPRKRHPLNSPRVLISAAVTSALLGAATERAAADVAVPALPAITVGVGVQTSFYNCQNHCVAYDTPAISPGETSAAGFSLDSVRLYVNGSVTDTIKMTFNTEYNSVDDTLKVMDAIGRFEFNENFNLWAGRFLPPSDRANLYGPYYSNDISPYSDGVADFYPNVAVGRDNGVAYWGDYGPIKVQAGAFDGKSLGATTAVEHQDKILVAGRVTWDFWDKETGYYFNGTYYGDKDLLALGAAAQGLDGKTAFSIDGIVEKNFHGVGVFGIESEYQHDDGLNTTAHNEGWYVLGHYILPEPIGWGKVQILDKYSRKSYDATSTSIANVVKTNEVNLNYIIKEFSARVGLYYLYQNSDIPSTEVGREFGVKLQLQM